MQYLGSARVSSRRWVVGGGRAGAEKLHALSHQNRLATVSAVFNECRRLRAIDVAECVHEKKFVLQRIDNDVFRKSLAEVVQQAGIAKPSLVLSFRYADVSLDPDQTKLMESAVTTICRQAGFAKVDTSMNGEGEPWHERVAQFTRLGDDLDATESPLKTSLFGSIRFGQSCRGSSSTMLTKIASSNWRSRSMAASRSFLPRCARQSLNLSRNSGCRESAD